MQITAHEVQRMVEAIGLTDAVLHFHKEYGFAIQTVAYLAAGRVHTATR